MQAENKDLNLEQPKEEMGGGLPLFYERYAKPLWVQVDTLAPGDVLVIKTQGTSYCVVLIGAKIGLLTANKGVDSPSEVLVYGGYDLETSQPLWGKIQIGVPFLFAPVLSPSNATKTSPIEAMYLRKAAQGYGHPGAHQGGHLGTPALSKKPLVPSSPASLSRQSQPQLQPRPVVPAFSGGIKPSGLPSQGGLKPGLKPLGLGAPKPLRVSPKK